MSNIITASKIYFLQIKDAAGEPVTAPPEVKVNMKCFYFLDSRGDENICRQCLLVVK